MSALKTLVLLYPDAIAFEVMLAAELLHARFPVEVATPDGADHQASNGMVYKATLAWGAVDPARYRCLLVPGGDPYEPLMSGEGDRLFQAADRQGAVIGAICAGPVLLTRSGILDGRRFTHGFGNEHKAELAPYWRDARFDPAPVVVDRNVVTAQPHAHAAFGVTIRDLAEPLAEGRTEELTNYYNGRFTHPAYVGL